MLAKIIRADRSEYYSYVFAISENVWKTAVVVFDEQKDEFVYYKVYRNVKGVSRSVFIVDATKDGFIESPSIWVSFKKIKNFKGYAWLVQNKQLLGRIIKNKPVKEIYKQKARELNANIRTSEWTIVKDDKDAKSLLHCAWWFHDGKIVSVNQDTQSDKLEVVISECCGAKITLLFEKDVVAQPPTGEGSLYLMDANVFFEDGYVCWVDNYEINSVKKSKIYFRGRKLSWKQETEYYKF